MDRSYVAENDAERERMRALVERLTDDDLRRSVGHGGWTAAVALAHLAYWDRRAVDSLEQWQRTGVWMSWDNADAVNDGMLPQWLAMPVREAAREALAAAEAIDQKVETVPPDLAEKALAQRPRSLIRALHRRDHLDEIERALGG